jgi:hypothetical protein
MIYIAKKEEGGTSLKHECIYDYLFIFLSILNNL